MRLDAAVDRTRRRTGVLIVAAVAAASWVPSPASAASFDCAKASTAQEKLICGRPDLSALDEQVAAAYAALLGQLGDPAKTAVRDSQRAWVKHRQATCPMGGSTADRVAPPPECLASVYEDRKTHLTGALTTRGGHRLLTVQRFAVATTGDPDMRARWPVYTTVVGVPRLLEPAGPGAERFNAATAAWGARFFRAGRDADTETYASAEVRHAGPRLISLQFEVSTYPLGAAHPQAGHSSLNWLVREGRPLAAADLFKPEAAWRSALAGLALERLHAEGFAKDEPFAIEDPRKLLDTTSDPVNWVLTPDALAVQFGAYAVGPYSDGAPLIAVPWSALKPHLVADPPLP
jgi:uncharacterized protein